MTLLKVPFDVLVERSDMPDLARQGASLAQW